MLRVVQEFTHTVGIELRIDKCAVVHFKRKRCRESGEEKHLVNGNIFRHLDDNTSSAGKVSKLEINGYIVISCYRLTQYETNLAADVNSGKLFSSNIP